jgi:hypothetical protein
VAIISSRLGLVQLLLQLLVGLLARNQQVLQVGHLHSSLGSGQLGLVLFQLMRAVSATEAASFCDSSSSCSRLRSRSAASTDFESETAKHFSHLRMTVNTNTDAFPHGLTNRSWDTSCR